jgi:hypothetical protein
MPAGLVAKKSGELFGHTAGEGPLGPLAGAIVADDAVPTE